uniref:Uncharacterized protein n=1 Tax=Nicotiana tabacum TaxID=4097 RepID=A0A1S4B3U1_TOBAC|nr:PREDICTED: uncharacterized protein LOC107804225 [Nicotiana tabacum]
MEGEKVLLKVSLIKVIMRFGKQGKLSPRSHVLDYNTIQMDGDLSYKEEPITIVDRQVRKLRSKEISVVKVQWIDQPVGEATWDTTMELSILNLTQTLPEPNRPHPQVVK